MSEANRHAQSKDPYPAYSGRGFERNFRHKSPHFGRRQIRRPTYRQAAAEILPSSRSAGGRMRPPLRNDLLSRNHRDRHRAGHHRRLRFGCANIHANDLSRLRRHQSHPPRQYINALRIAQGSIFQP
jgi:hypothetical protein